MKHCEVQGNSKIYTSLGFGAKAAGWELGKSPQCEGTISGPGWVFGADKGEREAHLREWKSSSQQRMSQLQEKNPPLLQGSVPITVNFLIFYFYLLFHY